MKFSYELSSIGWANVEFEINNTTTYIRPSYLTDSLGDLVKAIELLKPEIVDTDEVKDFTFFEWNCEPAIYKWYLSKINEDVVRIQIHFYADEIQEAAEERINGLCNFDDFIFEVVKSLEDLIKKHGIVGYRKQWHAHDFPISGYLQLKQYLMNREKFNVTIYNEDEWNEYYHSELFDECNLIKQEIKRI